MDSLRATDTYTAGFVIIQKDEFEQLRGEYEAITLYPNWQYVTTNGDSQGDKVREIWEQYKNGDWIGIIGDDQVVSTIEWDKKLISHINGWNVVTCSDNWIFNAPTKHWGDGRFCGAPCFSGPLVRELGWFFLPGTHQIFLDDTWEQLGHMTGCWKRVFDVNVDHLHYRNGLAEKDDTYSRAYDHYCHGDTNVWREWSEGNGAKNAAQKIIGLKERIEKQ
ncbi:MAG: hypothetical protein KGJ90_00330 [Patescibacteria group bacterium]|nr:hypothetical protein [Patescibacteria group bacterium]